MLFAPRSRAHGAGVLRSAVTTPGKIGGVDRTLQVILANLVGVPARRITRSRGGYAQSQCWSVQLADQRRVFVKVAVDDDGRAGNRVEASVLSALASMHAPGLVAVSEDATVLVTTDFSDADWGNPIQDLQELWAAIADIGSRSAPPGLPFSIEGPGRDPWTAVLADDGFATAIGVDRSWISRKISRGQFHSATLLIGINA